MTPPPPLEDVLRERFGLSAFRPWQREAIEAALAPGGRVLVIAPTGGGKSLCFQLPAVVLGGTTVVVSPLIALMEDQVRGLCESGVPATYLASNVPAEERRRRAQALREGAYRLVYVAPERLRSEGLVSLLRQLAPPLVAIDEAHCISQWGHDFRPDYLRIGEVLRALAPPRVIACTATATPLVRDEILERLGMGETTRLVLRGFARPNLHLAVDEVEGMKQRRQAAIGKVREALGPPREAEAGAIIYSATRRHTEALAEEMCRAGWRCLPYHAGLEPRQREEVSARFAARALNVVVATNAFGMGIDRPDIRAVVHLQAPGSIEQYYQEVGRAGRDGQPAHGLLLSGMADFGLRRRLIERGRAEREGARGEGQGDREWRLFLDLMRYTEAGSCRHDFILRYFGAEAETLGGCGHCDVCSALDEGGERSAAEREEELLVIRKALAGVARLRRRAGIAALAASLHGDKSARVEQLGLTALSTHGILASYPLPWITSVLRRLVTAGLVEVTSGDYPVPYLTPAGIAVMKAEEAPRMVLPPTAGNGQGRAKSGAKARGGASTPPAAVAPGDVALLERLKAERRSIAQERGVPAYVVCHDRTLVEIAARKPKTLAALADVHGMGPARIDAYGAKLLAVVTGGQL
jgi:ATP-dependent DNA helicase RecQ